MGLSDLFSSSIKVQRDPNTGAVKLTCSVDELQDLLSILQEKVANYIKYKNREPYLTFEERRAMKLLEDEIQFTIKGIAEKCGVYIDKDQLINDVLSNPDKLAQLSKVYTFNIEENKEQK